MANLLELCETRYFRHNPRIRDEKTRLQYRIVLKDFAASLGRATDTSDLTDDNVAAMMFFLLDRGLAIRTVNERRGRLNALWSWLARRGVLNTWPTTPPMPEPERTPIGWLRHEIPQLFAAFERERVLIAGIPAPAWWKSLHYAFWDSGERVTALISSRWEFLQGEWLMLPAEVRKGKRKDRAYRLCSDTLAAIEEIRRPKRDLIWPWPHRKDYLWTRYRKIRERVGLPTDRRSSFHRMRKTVASHFEAAGGDATHLLGHETRRITMSYLDPRIVTPPQAGDLLFRPEAG